MTASRRILVIAHELSSHGGMQLYVRSFAEALTPLHDVRALSRDVVPPTYGRTTRSRRKAAALAEQLVVGFLSRPDLVIADQVQSAAASAPLASSVRACFIHAAELTGGGFHRLKGVTLRSQQRLWGPTRWVCDYAVEQFGVRPDIPRVLAPPVDCDVFRPCDDAERDAIRNELGLDLHRPVVLSVARLDSAARHKGIDLTIAACKELADIRPQLVIAGDGDDLERLRFLAAESADVKFVGAISRSSLAKYMAMADVFSMPSHASAFGAGVRTEGFGIVYLEAAAAGVPAVRGTAPGTAEAVLDGKTAVSADPDPESVAAAIRHWIELDQRSREAARAACRKWALLHSRERFEVAARRELDLLPA
jgi:glycosyltransferase involved in cell wall biosynthesis